MRKTTLLLLGNEHHFLVINQLLKLHVFTCHQKLELHIHVHYICYQNCSNIGACISVNCLSSNGGQSLDMAVGWGYNFWVATRTKKFFKLCLRLKAFIWVLDTPKHVPKILRRKFSRSSSRQLRRETFSLGLYSLCQILASSFLLPR